MSVRILEFRDLKRLKGIPYCRVHLARLEKDGLFPARRQLGTNRVVWIEQEVDEHLLNLPCGTLPIIPNANRR